MGVVLLSGSFDCILLTDEGVRTKFMNSGDRSPAGRAVALADAFATSGAGDTIYIAGGLFDFGHPDSWNGSPGNVIFPLGVQLQGAGIDVTTLFGSCIPDNHGVVQFDLRSNDIFDMTISSLPYTTPSDEGVTIGYSGQTGVMYASSLTRVKMIGTEWCYYTWNNDGSSTVFNDCIFQGGRMGLSLMSNNPNLEFADCHNCLFDIDAARSNHEGATGSFNYGGVFGAVCRGGRVRLYDCAIDIRNRPLADMVLPDSYTRRAAGVTDQFNQCFAATFELHNLTCRIDPKDGDSALWGDTDIRNATSKTQFVWDGTTSTGSLAAGAGTGPAGSNNSFKVLNLAPQDFGGA